MGTLPSYPYTSLPSQCIRVLELRPGPSDAPLECNVVIQKIDGKPYEALSYVWGDPTAVTFVKCTDETHEGYLGVGLFLSKALFSFRLPTQTRRIWVDALCINQKDITERQSQVRLMGAVYGTAAYVLCWLGPFPDQIDAEARAKHTVSFLRRFNTGPREHLRAAQQHLHFGEDVEETTDDVALLDSWLGIKEMFDIEYFHRAWIIQEVGLAQHARFYWGTQDLWLDWDEIAAFSSFMDANGASIINHLGLKSWVANHINLVWANDESGKSLHNFVEVLHWARVHRSTDPRDYIYALLSHSSASLDGELIMQPNYRITTEVAYTKLAVNVIKRTNSLHILAFVDHHEEAGMVLPSWVPDWHALNLVAPLRCPTKAASETDNNFSVVECDKGMVLKCRGFLIDTIRAMSDMFDPSELTVTTIEKEEQKKIPFLIDHIWEKTVIEPKIPLNSSGELLASLSLVLTGGYRNDSNSTSGESQKKQEADLTALILEYERIRLPRHADGFLASLSFEDKFLIQMMADRGSAHQFVQDMTWTSMCRKVFRTAEGHIGLGPRIMREGDICVVLLGAVYPMVLRRSNKDLQLVGPALLHGFMNGEAEKLCRDGKLQEQGFEII
jgi:hypothetical protein